MLRLSTRRQFLARVGGAAGAALAGERLLAALAEPEGPVARVAVARDDTLTKGRVDEHRELLRKMLDASMQRLTDAPDAAAAWGQLFKPGNRVGIKVNTLGLSTQPAVVDAIVAGLGSAGVPAENVIIWDRLDTELANAGFRLNRGKGGAQCRGTDAQQAVSGYQRQIESSGKIGSCFSRIVA